MKTEFEILNKIKEIESDIHVINEEKIDNCSDVSDNIIRVITVSAAKRQIQLLRWVLEIL